MAKIYIVDKGNKINYRYLKESLPENVLKIVNKYTDIKSFESSLIGWYVLYNNLKKNHNIDLANEEIVFNDYGKPFVNNVYFNISHSKNLISVIIGDNECGIDIEKVNENHHKDKLVLRVLSDEELLFNNNNIEYFIKQWTKKEAYYKMKGTGISFEKLKQNINFPVCTYEILDIMNEKYYMSISIEDDFDVYRVENEKLCISKIVEQLLAV